MSYVPSETAFTVDSDSFGTVVWAVQRGMNERGGEITVLVEDSSYGPLTKQVVTNFQARQDLTVDGRFGPKTSERLARILCGRVPQELPPELLESMVLNESAFYIAAVNWTVAGGVDCGYCQRRVYGDDVNDMAVVKRAFDPAYQFGLLASSLSERHWAFYGRNAVQTHERAWRLAALHHNYPYAAKRISEVGVGGLSDYWTTPQDWVVAIGTRFPSGLAVKTPLQWCQRYALGNVSENEPGQAVRLVTSWATT